jgi:predicted protein tyrosine phosphatase
MGACHLGGFVTFCMLVWLGWPWSAPLAWAALTCGLLGVGHFGLGARIYGRSSGRLPPWSRCLLAWDRCAQEISRRYYRGRAPAWSKLAPNVWFGCWPDEAASRELREAGVTAVVDLAAEFESSALARSPSVETLFLDLLDLSVPSLRDLHRAADFIGVQSKRGIVFIHCKAGSFRSAAVAGAWLIASGRARTANDAIEILERSRAGLRVRPPIRHALAAFERHLSSAAAAPLRWVRDVQRDDPALFDLIFGMQDYAYRSNRLTRGLVWSYESFLQRSAGYVLFGHLPERKRDGVYPPLEEALASGAGFVLARPMPEGGPFLCLKLSIAAGNRRSVASACRRALRFGLPVIAAVESRMVERLTRLGFCVLPAWVARLVVPRFAAAFVQAPWSFQGLGPHGEVRVTHPDFRDPETGRAMLYEKTIVYSTGALRQLLHPGPLAVLLSCFTRKDRPVGGGQ